MTSQTPTGGQSRLRREVQQAGLCTGCTACVDLCPYWAYYKDTVIPVHDCDIQGSRCQTYCPRMPVDLAGLQQALFEAGDITPEMGPVKGLYMTRAADESIRAKAQHGGTVTALISLALSEGLIDRAVVAGQEDDLQTASYLAREPDQALAKAGSRFVVSPTLARFNRASKEDRGKLGVVATPCQSLALAKMRVYTSPDDKDRLDRLKIIIGLFCGWAFDWKKLTAILEREFGSEKILGLDIPPSAHQTMEVTTEAGTRDIPIEKVREAVRSGCNYCFDLTAEFADLSVGSARSPEGWAVDRGWNQVVVRSRAGAELLEAARAAGVLEFKPLPEGNLDKLKKASLGKKKTCLANLAAKSGNPDDLLYLKPGDAYFKGLAG